MANETIVHFDNYGKTIFGVGKNYRITNNAAPANTPKEPIIFLKPTSSYLKEGAPIKLMKDWTSLEYEVELGVIIGKTCHNACIENAMEFVAGYCLALDMTAREFLNDFNKKHSDMPWTVAKGFDTSCPVSHFIDKTQIPDPHDVDLWLKVNGEIKQASSTKQMIFSVPFLVSWLSDYFILQPGDLILTGTPEGSGQVHRGDTIECGLKNIIDMKFDIA